MFRIVMSSIMPRRRGLNSAIGGSCLRDGLQHPHPLRQKPLSKSPRSRRASGFVQSPCESDSTAFGINPISARSELDTAAIADHPRRGSRAVVRDREAHRAEPGPPASRSVMIGGVDVAQLDPLGSGSKLRRRTHYPEDRRAIVVATQLSSCPSPAAGPSPACPLCSLVLC
jgi:hypothetical protein